MNFDNIYIYEDLNRKMFISEDSLQRTLIAIANSSFAILSDYRRRDSSGKVHSKQDNILRNRKLRAFLNQNRIGVHQLVGHWPEVQKAGNIEDIVERSYLVEKPDDMSDKDFCSIIVGCLTIDGETLDGALIKLKSKDNNYYYMDAKQNFMYIGNKLTLGKLGDMYSQHIKKLNIPFVFEGKIVPQGMAGSILFKKLGFLI